MWIFGYGSLMWRPGFDYEQREIAFLHHYARELWQGSPDHRGVPDAPGRVATLVARDDAVCAGLAFRVCASERHRILRELDEREQGGYERLDVDVRLADGTTERALTYIGYPDNPHYLGPATFESMVSTVAQSHGPSGANRDYVLELVRTLRALQLSDPPMERLGAALAVP
ncbi:MAG: gamma-glutamylcyclotransferase [Gammaproteobacteria bacterium]